MLFDMVDEPYHGDLSPSTGSSIGPVFREIIRFAEEDGVIVGEASMAMVDSIKKGDELLNDFGDFDLPEF